MSPVLVVLRGNSASGKSAVAAQIRSRYGHGLAIVSQDNLRRTVLREHDVPGGANIELISLVARHALDAGFHTIVEGILCRSHYEQMLLDLRSAHHDASYWYYFDVPFEETLRRHATKPQATDYGEAEMRTWWQRADLLPGAVESIIPASSSLDDTVTRIMRETGLTARAETAG